MSTQAVAQFLEQLANKQDLRERLTEENKTKEERIAAAVVMGREKGFEFTEAECATILETARKTQAGELSEAELEAVAGGFEADLSTRIAASLYEAVNWLFGDDDEDEDSNQSGGTAIAGVRG